MTQTKRIILNVLTSYGRTIISVICGLFTTRWVLLALGHESFGLFGLIGGLVVFVSFLNIQLSQALSRYYAVAIGKAKVALDKAAALEECRAWFSCGVVIHTVIPLILVSIGVPVGTYAIRYGWLVIPAERVETCVWLWRFLCLSSLVGMVNSPFHGMFFAKQYIVELTIYSLAQTLIKTAFIYSMTFISIDWLLWYGLGVCLIQIVPPMVIFFRAFYVFPECRFRLSVIDEFWRVKQLMGFAFWNTFSGIGYLASHQCLAVIVNKYFGPKANAAYSVGNTFAGEASSLTGSLNAAFTPAIATTYGSEDMEGFRVMSLRASKFGVFLTLIFAIPMFLEVEQILELWLKTPPEGAVDLCRIILVALAVEKFSCGHNLAVIATGKVALFQFIRGSIYLIVLPISILSLRLCNTPNAVAFSFVIVTICVVLSDVICARLRAGLSIAAWLGKILSPLIFAVLLSGCVGEIFVSKFPPCFFRIVSTTGVVSTVFFVISWFAVLDGNERKMIRIKLFNLNLKLKRLFESN